MNFQEFQDLLAELRTDLGRSEYRVEGSFDQHLVVTEPVALPGIRFDQPVIIRCVTFKCFVDFSEWRCAASLRIEDCRFESGLRLADAHIEGLCSLKQCSFDDSRRGWLDFRRMQIGGLLDASNVTSKVGIDMANMQTGDDAWFSGAQLSARLRTRDNPDPNKPRLDDEQLENIQANWSYDQECKDNTKYLQDRALHIGGASIGKFLFFRDDAGRPVTVGGMLDLRAKVTGNVEITNATIAATDSTLAVNMQAATVGGSVFIREDKITGQVNLQAKVTGNVEIANATIAATESTHAVSMEAATVGGSVRIREDKITGQVNLRAKVTGNVEITNTTIAATESTDAFDMDAATVGGSVFMCEDKINGRVIMFAATVGGSVFIHDDDITGEVNLQAKVTGNVQISNATIAATDSTVAVNMQAATVGGTVFIHNGTKIAGPVDLRANVTGNVEIINSKITAPVSTIAVSMCRASVGGSVIIHNGTKIAGQVDLRANVTRNVEIINSTITAPASTMAVNMNAASVGRGLHIQDQTRIWGEISLFQATLGRLLVTGDNFAKDFQIPQDGLQCPTKTALIDGRFDLTYATINGPCQIHHLSHFGAFIARHLTVQGDFDLCGSIVGTTKTEAQTKWLDAEFTKPVPTPIWSAEETVERNTPAEKQKTIDLEMAEIHGRCWLKGTRVLGNIYLEDVEIAGEANFDEGEVHGDLHLRSSIIKGRVFADEHSGSTSYPRVKGDVDLSYAIVQQVDVKLEKDSQFVEAFQPRKIKLTGATIDTFSLKGEAKVASDFEIVTEQSTIQTIQFDTGNPLVVKGIPEKFGARDDLRACIFVLCCLVIFYLFLLNVSLFAVPVFIVFVVCNTVLWCYRHDPMNRSPSKPEPILDHLHLTKPFSRGYYVMVEQRLRSKGNDELADEVFLMRRKRERMEMHGFRLWSGFLDFIMGYGVRMHRLLVIYLLIGFFNWGVFLDKNSVERPIVFVQNRIDGAAWGKAEREPGSDVRKANVWPSDGGRAVGPNEWDAKHALFVALRLQIPIIQLVTENDWTPATRPMECPLFRWTSISYADFASVTMVLNLLLIPLLITGLTGYNKKL